MRLGAGSHVLCPESLPRHVTRYCTYQDQTLECPCAVTLLQPFIPFHLRGAQQEVAAYNMVDD